MNIRQLRGIVMEISPNKNPYWPVRLHQDVSLSGNWYYVVRYFDEKFESLGDGKFLDKEFDNILDVNQEMPSCKYAEALQIAQEKGKKLPSFEQLQSWFPVMPLLGLLNKAGSIWSCDDKPEMIDGSLWDHNAWVMYPERGSFNFYSKNVVSSLFLVEPHVS